MQAEISRRCLSCGASVRSGAMFCPECGESLAPGPDDSSSPSADAQQGDQRAESNALSADDASEPIEGESFAAVMEQKPESKASSADVASEPIEGESIGAVMEHEAQSSAEVASAPIEGESFAAVIDQKAPSHHEEASLTARVEPPESDGTKLERSTVVSETHDRPGAKAREKLQRASTAARGAIEENVKRVERIRQVSSVVLEEAHYDPSLRFVLVAVVLFLIVTLLLVLSKVMG